MADRCHYINTPGARRVLIPKCMGSAVYGIGGCTCPKPIRAPKQQKSLEKRVSDLEKALADMRTREPTE